MINAENIPRFFSPAPSLAPSDSISRAPSHASLSHAPTPLSSRRSMPNYSFEELHRMFWTPEKQASLERRIARLTASANFPIAWVDNIEWIGLCDEFIPSGKSPSRKVLAQRLIPTAVRELREEIKASVQGQNVTLQADGWTGENHHHLIAFMITVNGKVSTYFSKDFKTNLFCSYTL